jgi:tetratricopeptide (TPR) repeat protein/ubiquitin-protein ligase
VVTAPEEETGHRLQCQACGTSVVVPAARAADAANPAPDPALPRPRLPVRTRRLLADAEQMRRAFGTSALIRVHSSEGDPPELYRIEYHVRGLARGPGGEPVPRDSHLLEIQLTSEYPHVPPRCKVVTPIFHPNIDPATVCVGDHWAAGERLVDLVVRIGEMIAYQAYNIKSPLDGEAAMWADLNQQCLPTDKRDLRPGEAPPALETLPRTAIAVRREDRYLSTPARTNDLEPGRPGKPVGARAERWKVKLARWVSRQRALVSGVGAALLVGLVNWLIATRLLSAANEQLAVERDKVRQANRELRTKNAQLATARDKEDKARRRAEEAEQRAVAAAKAETLARQAEALARQAEAAQRQQAEVAANLLESMCRNLAPRTVQKDPSLNKQLVPQLDAAAALLDKAYADQPLVQARLRDALGQVLRGLGETNKAITLWEQALAGRRKHLPPNDPLTLTSMNTVAMAYRAAGQLEKALGLHEETLRLRKARLGPNHHDTLQSMNNLAVSYLDVGGHANVSWWVQKAVRLHEETLSRCKVRLPPDHSLTLTATSNLALAYQAAGQLDKAVPLFEEALTRRKKNLGPDHPDTLTSMNHLASAYLAAKQPEKALPLFRSFLAAQEKQQGATNSRLAGLQASVALALLKAGLSAEAEPILRQCLSIRVEKMPDHWLTFNTRSMLGGALLGQKKYQEAKPLLLQGWEGLKQRQAQLPAPARPRLTEALERLVQLYEATDRVKEAGRWRKELEAVKQQRKDKFEGVRRFRYEPREFFHSNIDLSPDGGLLLASAYILGPTKVWDVRSGRLRYELATGKAAFLPEGKQILTLHDNHFNVYEAETGRLSREFGFNNPGMHTMWLAPDGKTVVSNNHSGTLQLWEVATGKELKRWVHAGGRWPPVLYSPESSHILLWTKEGWRAWDIAAKKETDAFTKVANRPRLIAVLPGARQVVESNADSFAVLDVATGAEARRIRWKWKVNDEDAILGNLSVDGRRILTFHKDQTVRLHKEKTGSFHELGRITLGRKLVPYEHRRNNFGRATHLCFSADGRYAAAGSNDGDLIVLRLPDPPPGKKNP